MLRTGPVDRIQEHVYVRLPPVLLFAAGPTVHRHYMSPLQPCFLIFSTVYLEFAATTSSDFDLMLGGYKKKQISHFSHTSHTPLYLCVVFFVQLYACAI